MSLRPWVMHTRIQSALSRSWQHSSFRLPQVTELNHRTMSLLASQRWEMSRRCAMQRHLNSPYQPTKRGYIYIPLTWSEIKERFLRWVEQAEKRKLRVRLLNRKALIQSTPDAKMIPTGKIMKHQQRRRRLTTRTQKRNADRRRRRPWARWIMNQKQKAKNPLAASTLPLPLSSGTRFSSMTLENRNQNGISSVSLKDGVMDMQNRYQGWKSRRKEQYQGWKTRRKEQYQGWKLKRQEQYQGWKSRRQQKWNDTRSRAWERTRQILLQEYSRPEWFDSLGRPLTSRDSTGRFVNPWQSQSTNGIHSIGTIIRWRWVRLERELRQLGLLGKIKSAFPWSDTPPSTSPLLNQEVPPLPTPDQSSLQFTWIGHSTGLLYVQKDFSILVDPMFSVRASPYQNSPIGIARDIAPAFSIPELVQHQQKIQQSQLGTFDICCITHDHYDHMDENSIIDLRDHVQLWVVPLGIKKWLMGRCSIDSSRIVELKWWQQLSVVKKNKTVVVLDSERISGSQDDIVRPQLIEAPIEESSTMTITCCPASHWASRTMMDRNFRLWCSFAFLTEKFNFFYCGDTGYPDSFPLFHQIGDALGPFDFCAIPIAAYEPEEMMKDAHVNPKEAVKIHKDLRSNQSVAIHWGSFQLSEEPMDAPPQDLKHAIQEEEKSLENSEKINFSLLPHGGTFVVDKNAGAFAACNDDNESCAIDDCVSS